MTEENRPHRWWPDPVDAQLFDHVACRDCEVMYPDVGVCPGAPPSEADLEKKHERDRLVRAVTFTLHPHDNADTLSIARIDGTDWQCVTRTDQWSVGEDGHYHGIYLAIDALLDPTVPSFSFLKPTKKFDDGRPGHRLKTVRLRGKLSQGLLIPIPASAPGDGQSWAEALKVERYEPPVPADMSGDRIRQPGSFPNYMHIENAKNFPDVFQPGDLVRVTEKIHGTSLKVGLVDDGHDDPIYIVGSHKTARATDGTSVYPTIAREHFPLALMHRARTNAALAYQALMGPALVPPVAPAARFRNFIVFAEIYGVGIQDLHYGCAKNERRVAIFDVLYNDIYMPEHVLEVVSAMLNVPLVPLLFRGPFDKEKILALRDGKTTIAGDHLREGVVVTGLSERWVDTPSGYSGRAILKYISDDYLERSGAKDGH